MKYPLPNKECLRKEARSLRTKIRDHSGTKLALDAVEKLIAQLLGYRDSNELKKDCFLKRGTHRSLLEWRRMDAQFVRGINKEFPGIGDVSLTTIRSALSMSTTACQNLNPLSALEMCLLTSPPEFTRGPIGILMDGDLIVDPNKALDYFLTLAGFQDPPLKQLESVIDEGKRLCQQKRLALDIPTGLNQRQEALEVFHVLSGDMAMRDLKRRFRGQLSAFRSLYFALDSLPVDGCDDSFYAHPEASPLVYAWLKQRQGKDVNWKSFVDRFRSEVSTDNDHSDQHRLEIPREVALENEQELLTEKGFLEGYSPARKAIFMKQREALRYPMDDPHWTANTAIIAPPGYGSHKAIMTYLYPVIKAGKGGMVVLSEGRPEMAFYLQSLMAAAGRSNDFVFVSSLYGIDDPWGETHMEEIRKMSHRVYLTRIEQRMANSLFDLLDRKSLLEMECGTNAEAFRLALVEHLLKAIEASSSNFQNLWQSLCLQYCNDNNISHQLWEDVVKKWVLNFADNLAHFHSSNPLMLATPNINWGHAIDHGKLIVCLEPDMEKDPSIIAPFVLSHMDRYANETRRRGTHGFLFSVGLNGRLELSDTLRQRITDENFTWVCTAQDVYQMQLLLGRNKGNQALDRIVTHLRDIEKDFPDMLALLRGKAASSDQLKNCMNWRKSSLGDFIHIENGQVRDIKLSYVSTIGASEFLKQSSVLRF